MYNSLPVKKFSSSNICLGLFAASFIFYLLFSYLLPITDPVESNYALTAKEMVMSTDWLSPQIYGKAWFDKPVFFYWLTAAAFKFFGFSDIAARLVPAFFAGLGVSLAYWFGIKTSRPEIAILAAFIMGTSLEYVLLAKLIITDMVFFVFNSAALVFFYFGYVEMDGTKKWYLLMYASLALATLTKGPVGLVLPGLVIVAFIVIQRNFKELKNMFIPTGVLVFLVIAMPWYVAMYSVHGSDFLNTFLGVHNYLRATVSEHPEDNVIYYYIVVFFISMLPWSPLVLKAMLDKRKGLVSRNSTLISFSLIWAAVYVVFYSSMATKYLTYTFPIVFPLAMVAAHYLEELLVADKKSTVLCWVGIPAILVTLIYIAVSYRYLEGQMFASTVSSLILVILVTWWQAKRHSIRYVIGLLCLCHLSIYTILAIFVFPTVAYTRSEKELVQNIASYNEQKLGFYDFYSTSAVYYSGKVAVKITPIDYKMTQIQQLGWATKYTMPNESLPHFIADSKKEGILIVVPKKKQKQFLTETLEYNPQLLQSTEEFSYYYLNG